MTILDALKHLAEAMGADASEAGDIAEAIEVIAKAKEQEQEQEQEGGEP